VKFRNNKTPKKKLLKIKPFPTKSNKNDQNIPHIPTEKQTHKNKTKNKTNP